MKSPVDDGLAYKKIKMLKNKEKCKNNHPLDSHKLYPFNINSSIFGQLNISPFIVNGIKFIAAGYYVAYYKALLFNDRILATKILSTLVH